MRILIIGGTGLISTAITRQLLEKEADVTLFNRGKTPPRFPKGAKLAMCARMHRVLCRHSRDAPRRLSSAAR
jgi:uncharacterized protein YbjT (DUF2867 family)